MLIPTSLPSRPTSGPPELPGLSAASVCTRLGKRGESGAGSRSEVRTAETTPAVVVSELPPEALAG